MIALDIAAHGAAIASTDLGEASAQDTAAEIVAMGGRAIGLALDVTSSASVAEAVETAVSRLGPPDILVNNAAIDIPRPLLETSDAEWDAVHAVTLRGVFLMLRAVIPLMAARRRGAIVNIASASGLEAFGSDAYSAAKAGVLSLTRSAAVGHGRDGIRVNAICPGTIETPAWAERLAADPGVLESLARWYPVGHIGRPEDVSSLTTWLVSDAARFVSGAIIPVDGGLTAGQHAIYQALAGGPRG